MPSKVQQGIQTQLKVLQSEQAKGKSAGKVGAAREELQSLMNFSTSITQCVAKAMEHVSDFAFVSIVNVTLDRRDSYLVHVKSGLKQDTLAALLQAPLNLTTLFPVSVLKMADEDIGRFEDKGRSHGQSFSPLQEVSHRNKSLVNQLGNNWDASVRRQVVISPTSSHHVRLGFSRHINDNYCVSAPVPRQLTRSKETVKCVSLCQLQQTGLDKQNNRETVNLYQCQQTGPVPGETVNVCQSVTNVNSVVVNHAHIAQGQPQRKRCKSGCCKTTSVIKIYEQCLLCQSIVFCQTVPNVQTVVKDLPVGARLNQFWET